MKTPLILTAALLLGLTMPAAASMTMESCEQTRETMLQAAEENRDYTIKQLEFDLGRSADDNEAARLAQEIEHTWDNEEAFRSIATQVYRECVAHVKSGGS